MAERDERGRPRRRNYKRNEARSGSAENRERQWRRFDEDPDFHNRPGSLERRWGYGDRLSPGYRGEGRDRFRDSEFEAGDPYNAPDYWADQDEWQRPGPYTGYGPKGYRRSDERILEDVCDRLTQHAEIDASDIEVEVKDGEVTLTGTVENRRIKRLVEANAEMIAGVVDVHNQLKLRTQPSREELARENIARKMADQFPGGPTPVGNAGYADPENHPEED